MVFSTRIFSFMVFLTRIFIFINGFVIRNIISFLNMNIQFSQYEYLFLLMVFSTGDFFIRKNQFATDLIDVK